MAGGQGKHSLGDHYRLNALATTTMATPVPEPILARATFHNNHAQEFLFLFLFFSPPRSIYGSENLITGLVTESSPHINLYVTLPW